MNEPGVRTWWAWRRTGWASVVHVSASVPENTFSKSKIMESGVWCEMFGRLPKQGAKPREYRTELIVRKAGKFAKRKAKAKKG